MRSSTRSVVGAAALAMTLAGLAGWFLLSDEPPIPGLAPNPASPLVETHSSEANRGDRSRATLDPDGFAENVTITVPEVGVIAPAPVSEFTRGRVLDLGGRPRVGVPISFSSKGVVEIVGETDNLGEFVVRANRPGLLSTESPKLVNVRASRFRPGEHPHDHFVIVTDAIEISGRVMDEQRVPLEGVRLEIGVGFDALAALSVPTDDMEEPDWTTITSPGGEFVIPKAPAGPKAHLVISKTGYVEQRIPMPVATDRNLVFLLVRSAATDSTLLGRVVLQGGEPATAARVILGMLQTDTDADGRFVLPLSRPVSAKAALVAVQVGFQPAFVPDFGRLVSDRAVEPAPVTLVLPGGALTIEGHVVLADGTGAVGWRVEVLDPTPLESTVIPPRTLEDAVRGNKKIVLTDGAGAFRIEGLSARSYVCRAWDPKSLISVRSGETAAGVRDMRLVVPARATVPKLSGVVRSRSGAPVSGVSVRLGLRTWVAPELPGGGLHVSNGIEAVTDDQGRFQLADVPCAGARLYLDSASILSDSHELESACDGEEVEVRVSARCYFQFETSQPLSDHSFLQVTDDSGNELVLHVVQSNEMTAGRAFPLEAPQSPVLMLGEEGRTLLIYDGSKELARMPLHLVPGVIVRVRR